MESPETIMQERIEQFNRQVLKMDFSQLPVGLYYGKMGLCIYFYELAGLTAEKKYRIAANKILNDTVNMITENLEIDPSNGLTGICMAINFLIDAGYIEGNPNRVLKTYDDRIIQSLLFNRIFDSNSTLDMIRQVMGSLAYLTTRLQYTGLSGNERHIMQGVIVEILNRFESLDTDKFAEPALFSVTTYFIPFYLQLLQRIYQLNFYNYKIDKIIAGLSPHILSTYPLNHANRFSLYSAIKELQDTVGNITGWDRHIELLKQSIYIHPIISEFRNKNISFGSGLCGFYYLLRKTGVNDAYHNLFIHKITDSDIWDQFFNNDDTLSTPVGLYSGIPGVILTYLHILYRSKSIMFFDKVISQYV